MEKILVSSCLLGQNVRYDGGHKALEHSTWDQWQAQGCLIAFLDLSRNCAAPLTAYYAQKENDYALRDR